jgi:hypothetical protein
VFLFVCEVDGFHGFVLSVVLHHDRPGRTTERSGVNGLRHASRKARSELPEVR